ncbi:MAG TPA: hypothetical protein VN285_08385 [Candidatus Deferrimicrobium sp.]|nr:hypothetical protein [Candidatus Deferrimicrobium sp.]
MKDDINVFSDKELEDMRPWVEAKRDHFQGILDKIDNRLRRVSQRNLPLSVVESNGHASLDKVYDVMLQTKHWLGNQEILRLLKEKTGIKLTANGIRVYLRQGEKDGLFRRDGKSRFTKWKAIEKKNLQSQ